ncbi:hypothetical protein EDC01DRAFT_775254 [Geopyxis carbonaria]|nr:hypothetical protein EDC01DRAFT_775254 [Geopyxis carbonaria]
MDALALDVTLPSACLLAAALHTAALLTIARRDGTRKGRHSADSAASPASPAYTDSPETASTTSTNSTADTASPAETTQPELYSDEDGTATRESCAAYRTGFQKFVILAGSVAGVGCQVAAIAVAAVATATAEAADGKQREIVKEALFGASWCLLALHAIILSRQRAPALVFRQAQTVFWLSATLLTSQAATTLLHIYTHGRGSTATLGLTCGTLAASAAVLTASLLLPRRPAVFFNSHEVDARRTTTLLSRYTFAWAGSILSKAVRQGRLDERDIPVLNRRLRAEQLLAEFEAIEKSPRLFVQVLRAHKGAFVRQYFAIFVGITLTFTPPLVIAQILRTLEARDRGEQVGWEGWAWVAALGAVKGVEVLVLAHVYWMSFFEILVPIRGQLSALVFGKTMRKKDVKGSAAQEASKEDNKDGGGEKDEEEEEVRDVNQGTINLLSVDSERVAMFLAMSSILLESLFGTIYGFAFIVYTLGWESLLAGAGVLLLTTPVNIYFSKKYSTAQDDLMKVRDKKMAVLSEALAGIRQIKFSALEDAWEAKIRAVRAQELRVLRRVFIADVMVITAWIVNPVFLAAFALSAYALKHGSLAPSVAFPALAVFGELEFTLSIVPEMVTDGVDALVSIGRIQKYLDSAEKQPVMTAAPRIALVGATVAWAADGADAVVDRFCLRGLDLEFPRGELSVISGRTGAGKSLLLSALLGEADLLSGRIEMPAPPTPAERSDAKAHRGNWILSSAVAFVAQIPWIENGTIRDNIVFGLPFDQARYEATLHACALEKDMEALEDGEMTEIGANGINLSGGQRWRVSFARAVYSRAGILILDDIFSAVDAHVGKHIFEHGLAGELMRGRTRILVTHHLKLVVAQAAYTVVLANGAVENVGSVAELRQQGVLEDIIARQEAPEEAEPEEQLELARTRTKDSVRSRRAYSTDETARPAARQFVPTEERAKGSVTWAVYSQYITASGGMTVWFLIMLFFAFQEGMVLGRNYWVKLWTADHEDTSHLHPLAQYSLQRLITVAAENRPVVYWVGIYVAVSLVACLTGTARYAYIFTRSLRASRVLFDAMLAVVLRAPLRWLDTVPTGRILNRFSKDFETIDDKVINDIAFLLMNALGLLGVNAAAVYLSPPILLLAMVGLLVNVHLARLYLAGARELKRLESTSRSPIFELFGAALSGVATIRAYARSPAFVTAMNARLDAYSQRTYFVWLFNRWVGLRMSATGSAFATLVALGVVALPGIDAPLAGFALSFALNYTLNVVWALRRYANVELDMNSTERIVEYAQLPTEPADGARPPAAWPTEGRVEVSGLRASYAPHLPPVLDGVSFTALPRQRVGIVGRTGAGKSSLALALFRFLHADAGSICIDGLDIATLRLQDLRSRIAIIPQDPVLFSGTIRSNLDPFNEHGDGELEEALQRVHLTSSTAPAAASANTNPFSSLATPIASGGLNLSQGQRQLLCLARAIIARPKLLVLDEATSAVDMDTDTLIQKSIREEFGDCTTLVIAHRLQTVVEFDRVLVMGDGRVLEEGAPWDLMKEGNRGEWWEMCMQTGEGPALEVMARRAAGVKDVEEGGE